jgi:hypothetical protein
LISERRIIVIFSTGSLTSATTSSGWGSMDSLLHSSTAIAEPAFAPLESSFPDVGMRRSSPAGAAATRTQACRFRRSVEAQAAAINSNTKSFSVHASELGADAKALKRPLRTIRLP